TGNCSFGGYTFGGEITALEVFKGKLWVANSGNLSYCVNPAACYNIVDFGGGDSINGMMVFKPMSFRSTIYTKPGRVGILTSNPAAELHVNATMMLEPTDSPGVCSSSAEEGMIYFDDSENKPCYCDGSSWKRFDGGGVCT
ncbi:hypothetical protein ACFL3V_07185, partial [Nanoarchaeota archaeon]